MEQDIKNAAASLENWLSHPSELGHKPSKLVHTSTFVDADGIQCMVFKFKPSLLGKWMLGIVSESGTFSNMQAYDQATERQDAQAILDMLKNYWKEQARAAQDK